MRGWSKKPNQRPIRGANDIPDHLRPVLEKGIKKFKVKKENECQKPDIKNVTNY